MPNDQLQEILCGYKGYIPTITLIKKIADLDPEIAKILIANKNRDGMQSPLLNLVLTNQLNANDKEFLNRILSQSDYVAGMILKIWNSNNFKLSPLGQSELEILLISFTTHPQINLSKCFESINFLCSGFVKEKLHLILNFDDSSQADLMWQLLCNAAIIEHNYDPNTIKEIAEAIVTHDYDIAAINQIAVERMDVFANPEFIFHIIENNYLTSEEVLKEYKTWVMSKAIEQTSMPAGSAIDKLQRGLQALPDSEEITSDDIEDLVLRLSNSKAPFDSHFCEKE